MLTRPRFYPAIEREDGTYAFYPWGPRSRGYEVSKQQGQQINTLFLQLWFTTLPVSLACFKIFDGAAGLGVAMSALLIGYVFYAVKVKQYVADKPELPAQGKESIFDQYNRMFSRGRMIVYAFGCLFFAVGSAAMAEASKKLTDQVMGYGGVVLFGLGFVVMTMAAIRWRPPVG